jgi:DNA primase
MGATVSQMQASLITGLVPEDGRIWLFPDGDQTGVCMAESALKLLSPHRFVRWVKLDNGKQPTDAGPSELQKLLPMI